MKRLAEVETKDLGSRLAILQGVQKLVKDELGPVRGELSERLAGEVAKGTADSIPLTINGQKVGRFYATSPSVGISDDEAFGGWAYEHGEGCREIVIRVDKTRATEDDLHHLNLLLCQVEACNASVVKDECVAYAAAKQCIAPVGGAVIDADGEIVPGAYVKAPQCRTTPIKPAKVAEALRLGVEQPTIAGLLAGE